MKRALALFLVALLLCFAPPALAEETRDVTPKLANIEMIYGEIEPAFSPDHYEYTLYTELVNGMNACSFMLTAYPENSLWTYATPDYTYPSGLVSESPVSTSNSDPYDDWTATLTSDEGGPTYTFHVKTPTLPKLTDVTVDAGRLDPAFNADVHDYTLYTDQEDHYSITFYANPADSTWNYSDPFGTLPDMEINEGQFGGSLDDTTKDFKITVASTVAGGPTYTFNVVAAASAPKPGTVYYPDYDEEETEPAEAPQGGKITEYLVVCRSLNVRSTPSTALPRIGSLRRGDVVQVLALENDWARIVWEDEIAYVHTDYLVLAPEQR